MGKISRYADKTNTGEKNGRKKRERISSIERLYKAKTTAAEKGSWRRKEEEKEGKKRRKKRKKERKEKKAAKKKTKRKKKRGRRKRERISAGKR